jgi:hypothetical protein
MTQARNIAQGTGTSANQLVQLNSSGQLPAVSGAHLTSVTPGNGTVAPASMTTGGPSWDSSGNLSFNSGYGSSAVGFGVRSWLNYNMNTQAIRGSGNVSSVTLNSTGYFTVNFATALPDANYSVVSMGEWASGVTNQSIPSVRSTTPPTTGNCSIVVSGASSFINSPWVTVQIVR